MSYNVLQNTTYVTPPDSAYWYVRSEQLPDQEGPVMTVVATDFLEVSTTKAEIIPAGATSPERTLLSRDTIVRYAGSRFVSKEVFSMTTGTTMDAAAALEAIDRFKADHPEASDQLGTQDLSRGEKGLRELVAADQMSAAILVEGLGAGASAAVVARV